VDIIRESAIWPSARTLADTSDQLINLNLMGRHEEARVINPRIDIASTYTQLIPHGQSTFTDNHSICGPNVLNSQREMRLCGWKSDDLIDARLAAQSLFANLEYQASRLTLRRVLPCSQSTSRCDE